MTPQLNRHPPILRQIWLILTSAMLACCSVNAPRLNNQPSLDLEIERSGGAQPVIAVDEFLAVDEAMREFVRAAVAGVTTRQQKIHRLMQAIFRPGEYTIDYEAEHSFTASQTFHRRSGNCLSTTALLVALAREAGLKAWFLEFGGQPELRVDESVWIFEKHVAALVDLGGGNLVSIDFDRRRKTGGNGQKIDDLKASAHFFSNLGVNALQLGDLGLAHANFRRATELYPRLAYVWNNMGVLYNRVGQQDRAEEIFLYAISMDPNEFRAMSNLAALYRRSGRAEQAIAYEQELELARRRDPYYLYLLSSRAFEDQKYDESINHIRRAIRLKDDEPAFHQLLQEIQARQAGVDLTED
jgi:tetratricopeptide (TPR) repeat protein